MPKKPRARKGTGSVYFHKGRKRWIGETSAIVNGERQRREVSHRVKTEAQTRLTQLKIEIAEKREFYEVGDGEKVAGFLTAWVDTLDIASSTILRYRSLLKVHVLSRPAFASVKMRELEPQHVLALYADLKQSGSSSTTKKVHTMLHCAFESARFTRKGFTRNPCDIARNQKPKYKPNDPGYPFDAAKETAFLDACKGDWFEALFVLALDAGMRQGELFGLEWRHVNWTRSIIDIFQTLTDGEDGLKIGPTKNRRHRSVEVSETTMAALRANQKAQAGGGGLRSLVFPNESGGFLSRQNFDRRDFKRVLAKAQAESEFDYEGHTFHDLRHTCATLLLSEGEPITEVSKRLGHASPQITLTTYAHVLAHRDGENKQASRFEQRRNAGV
jgi:integrase